jgi:hypothetical protein
VSFCRRFRTGTRVVPYRFPGLVPPLGGRTSTTPATAERYGYRLSNVTRQGEPAPALPIESPDLEAWRSFLWQTCPACGCKAIDAEGVCSKCGATKPRPPATSARVCNPSRLLVQRYGRIGGQCNRQDLAVALAVPHPQVSIRHTPDERLARGRHQGAGVARPGQRLRARKRSQGAPHRAAPRRPGHDTQPLRVALVARREPKNSRHFAGSSSPRSERRYAADSSALSSSPRSAWSRPSLTASRSSGCGTNTGSLELCLGFVDGPAMGTSVRRAGVRCQMAAAVTLADASPASTGGRYEGRVEVSGDRHTPPLSSVGASQASGPRFSTGGASRDFRIATNSDQQRPSLKQRRADAR